MAWSFGRQMILAGMALAICFLTTNADENGWQSIAVEKSFDNSPFTYRMKLSARRSGYKIYKLYYPSPVATPVVQNNTIPAEYYLPDVAEGDSTHNSPLSLGEGTALQARYAGMSTHWPLRALSSTASQTRCVRIASRMVGWNAGPPSRLDRKSARPLMNVCS